MVRGETAIRSDSQPEITGPGCTVLLLEDDPIVREHLIDYLQAPHVLLIACSEIEAAECLLERSAPQVLVTDLCVSSLGGLEGMRLIRYASTHFPQTRVVVYSGFVDDEIRRRGLALGADEVLQKPRDLPRLQDVVRRAIRPLLPGVEGCRCEGVLDVECLEEILARRRIRSLFQPILDLEASGPPFGVYGVEALARGPRGSALRDPELLFGYAQRKRMVLETDLHSIEVALGEARVLPRSIRLLLNAQPATVASPNFAGQLRERVRAANFDERQVIVELTEQAMIVNPGRFGTAVAELRDHGFRLALDDYGEGFANLHLLEELRPEFLKVSGHFTRDVDRQPVKQAIVSSTVELARRLGLNVIMEQVETERELATLRRLGARYAQGFHLGRPARAAEVALRGRFPGRPAALHREVAAVVA